jgi:hypothetical protein
VPLPLEFGDSSLRVGWIAVDLRMEIFCEGQLIVTSPVRAISTIDRLRIEQVEDAWKPGLPGELVNDRGDRQVIRIQIKEWDRTIYLKRWRFPPGSPARLLPGKSALRGRGGSEFKNLKELASLGIRVPTPLFFGEERPIRWLRS